MFVSLPSPFYNHLVMFFIKSVDNNTKHILIFITYQQQSLLWNSYYKKKIFAQVTYHNDILSRRLQESDVLILRNGLAAYQPMHSVSRSPRVIYKWSSLGTPKPRARLEEKEATEGWERGAKGRGNEGENRRGIQRAS